MEKMEIADACDLDKDQRAALDRHLSHEFNNAHDWVLTPLIRKLHEQIDELMNRNDLRAEITQAKAALVGDSNDVEHDALHALVTALGYEVPDCNCTMGDYPHHDETCPAKAWEAKIEDQIPVQDEFSPDAISAREYKRST